MAVSIDLWNSSEREICDAGGLPWGWLDTIEFMRNRSYSVEWARRIKSGSGLDSLIDCVDFKLILMLWVCWEPNRKRRHFQILFLFFQIPSPILIGKLIIVHGGGKKEIKKANRQQIADRDEWMNISLFSKNFKSLRMRSMTVFRPVKKSKVCADLHDRAAKTANIRQSLT